MSMNFSIQDPEGKARAFSNALALLGECMAGVVGDNDEPEKNEPGINRPFQVGMLLRECSEDMEAVLAGMLTDPLQLGLTTEQEINHRVWHDAAWGAEQCCIDPLLYEVDPEKAESLWFARGEKYPLVAKVMAAYAVFDVMALLPSWSKEKAMVLGRARRWLEIIHKHFPPSHHIAWKLHRVLEAT